MAMEFAVNYSLAAADLLREEQIQVDLFKCPAWPDLIAAAQEVHPVYVHFPLRVGAGINHAIDYEAVADRDVLATQIPHLYDLVKGELKDAAELDPVRPRHEVL